MYNVVEIKKHVLNINHNVKDIILYGKFPYDTTTSGSSILFITLVAVCGFSALYVNFLLVALDPRVSSLPTDLDSSENSSHTNTVSIRP